MARYDWYRNEIWNAEIERDFEQRLARARHKSQYLKLQALHLSKSHPTVSLSLLDRYFSMPAEIDIAQAHVIRAQARAALGDLEGALASYELALERERQFPRWLTYAYLDYPFLVVKERLVSRYPRALEVLDAHQHRVVFAVDRYRAHGMRSLILQHFGRKEEAQVNATLAIAAAEQTYSGFRCHPDVGLVRSIDDNFGKRVAALAAPRR